MTRTVHKVTQGDVQCTQWQSMHVYHNGTCGSGITLAARVRVERWPATAEAHGGKHAANTTADPYAPELERCTRPAATILPPARQLRHQSPSVARCRHDPRTARMLHMPSRRRRGGAVASRVCVCVFVACAGSALHHLASLLLSPDMLFLVLHGPLCLCFMFRCAPTRCRMQGSGCNRVAHRQ